MRPIHHRARHLWTADEVAAAAKICRRVMANYGAQAHGVMAEVDRQIAAELRLDVGAVANRRRNYGNNFARAEGKAALSGNPSRAFVPRDVFAERDARNAAADRRTFTQTFFGDPPPGYSALDRQARSRT